MERGYSFDEQRGRNISSPGESRFGLAGLFSGPLRYGATALRSQLDFRANETSKQPRESYLTGMPSSDRHRIEAYISELATSIGRY
ncbi:MAG TPA: hypothetical protein VFN51_02515 [Candidatus Saccharimonadales bacterium]|nr:hypothetical protein [Candidatus Saccharimonadales bacterium]